MNNRQFASSPKIFMQRIKELLRKFLGIPVTILAFLFIFKIFIDNNALITRSLLTVNPVLFLMGVFFFSSFFAIKSFIWLEILKKRGFAPHPRETIFKYSLSEVKRYVPGSLFAFMGRMQALAQDIPQKETLKGIGIEALLLALSAAIVSIPALAYPLFKAREQQSVPFFVPIVGVIVLFIVISSLIYSRFRKTLSNYFDSLLLFILAWILYALGCFFIAISFSYIYPGNMVFVLSFFILSWLAGYLLFITPMGLGVRELVMIGSLSLFVPLSVASAIAILTRLGMIVGELFYLCFSYILNHLKNNSRLLKINPYLTIVVIFAITYFTFFTSYTVMRHDAYISGRFDLGNMSQTVWNTTKGNFFMLTNPDGTERISRLADHSDILLVLFAPLYLIWSDPRMLLMIQSLALACGGIVVYFLGKEIIKNEKLSLALSISFYLNFWIHEQNIFDFHAVSIGTVLLLTTFLFLLKRRYFWFGFFLLLSVMTKENVFLVASIFGLYLLFRQKKIMSGIILTIVPTLIFFYLTSKAIPDARGNIHFALSYYSYLGGSTQGIVKNLIINPQIIFKHLFSWPTIAYLHEIFTPTGYLALINPIYLVFALPDMAISLLSSNQNLRSYQYHYGAIIMPFVYISTMYGIITLKRKLKYQHIDKAIFYYILFTAFLTAYFYSPIPGMKDADYRPYTTQNTKEISEYLSLIPKNASVSASNNIGAHLSHRENIYVIPFAMNSADFVVFYKEKKSTVNSIDHLKYEILVQDTQNGFFLFKKTENKCTTHCLP